MPQWIIFYRNLIAGNKLWIKKTAVWAVFWSIVGALTFMVRPESASDFIEAIQRIFKDILGGKELTLDFSSVWLIFRNNFEAALVVLFGGILLGLIPLASLGINFFILGYLLALFGTGNEQGLTIFLATVAPHGIVELPLFLLAAGFGLRLGWFWRLSILASNWQKFRICLRDNIRLVPLLAVGFFLAAMLEIFVSGRLAQYYAGQL